MKANTMGIKSQKRRKMRLGDILKSEKQNNRVVNKATGENNIAYNKLLSTEILPIVNFTKVSNKSLNVDPPTTIDQAGEAAAADKPVPNCLGNINNHGISNIKIKKIAGIKDLIVCIEILFRNKNK